MDEPRILELFNLPNDIKTYTYRGHGGDVCNIAGVPITRRVPKGCIYVTIEEISEVTYSNEGRERSFHSQDADTRVKLKYPYLREFMNRDLRELFGIDPSARADIIRVRLPGENYVVNRLSPLAYWAYGPGDRWGPSNGFATSGLCEKSLYEQIVLADYPKPGYFFDTRRELMPNIDKRHIIQYFNASIFPTQREVTEGLREFPNLTPTNGSWDELKRVLRRMDHKIEEQCGIFNIDGDEDGPNAFLSNTYLMERFPGIHYNLVCRATQEFCKRGATRRRANSIVENTGRRTLLSNVDIQNAIIDRILANEPDISPELRRRLNELKIDEL